MRSNKPINHVTPADGNVFEDLGFPKEDAARLLAEVDQSIDEKRAIKEKLMTEIAS
jgi:predicted XRE-type DNA-binding protein